MFIFLFFLYSSILPGDMDTLLVKGLEFSYVENYDSAGYYFNEMIKEYPDHPAGYFMKTGLLLLYLTDYERDDSLDYFLAMVDTVLDVVEKYKIKAETETDSAWAYFFEGGAYLYRGFWNGRGGRYVKAFNDGVTAIDKMDYAIKMDSTVYDAYLGTGGFHYFQYKLKHILSIGIVSGADKSIAEIQKAVEKGHFSNIAAMDILVVVLTEEKRFNEAWNIVDSLRAMYPKSRTFQWAATKIADKEGKPYKAVKEYMKLWKMIERDQPDSYYNLIFVAYKIAEWAKKAKMTGIKDRYKKYVIDHEEWGKYDKKIKKYIKKTRRL